MWLLEVRWKSTCLFVAHVGLQVAMGKGVWVKMKVLVKCRRCGGPWWGKGGKGENRKFC